MVKKNTVRIGKRTLEISNEDKILFPQDKITKGEMIDYYEKMAKTMLPKISDRPIMMDRYPNGLQGQHWIQKNISDYFPSWIRRKKVGKEKELEMVICNDAASLVYLANLACITPHVWLSKSDKLDYPDRMIFDLDPPKGQFKKVVKAAQDLKQVLEKKLKLPTFLMVTGSKGLHIIVPLKREQTFKEVRAFAKKVGQYVSTLFPKEYTINPRKEKRVGKVFIDYLRNGYGQTVVAPFALRAIKKAPIAMPISWQQLHQCKNAQEFQLRTLKKRPTNDPWRLMDKKAVNLKKPNQTIDLLIEQQKAS